MPELFILNENDLIILLNNKDIMLDRIHNVVNMHLNNTSIDFPELSIYGWGETDNIEISNIEIYEMENYNDRYSGYVEVSCSILYTIVANNPMFTKDELGHTEYIYDYEHEIELCIGMSFEYSTENQEFIFENEEIV